MTLEDRSVPAVFTVNLLSDTGATSGANAGDLRYCLTQAQEGISAGADTIIFDATVFGSAKTITLTNVLPTIDNGLTITGTGSAKVRLDLDNTALATAVLVTDPAFVPGAAVSITGLTMANANSSTDMYVTFTDANASLADVVFDKGSVSGNISRGLNFLASAPASFTPTITLTNCSISGTTSTFVATSNAGQYYSAPLSSQGCDITITGCSFSNNNFTKNSTFNGGPISGGALLRGDKLANAGTGNEVVVTNSTFTGNNYHGRGAIATLLGLKTITIADCKVDNNKAGNTGGGISLLSGFSATVGAEFPGADVQVLRTSITGNFSLGQCGGAYIGGSKSVLIESTSIVSNQGFGGICGGLWLDGMPASTTVQVSNSTIASNISGNVPQGSSSGGGVRIGQGNKSNDTITMVPGTTFKFDNCTIANNKQTLGAIRHFNGNVFITSCIFDGNNGSVPNIADFDSLNNPTQVIDTLYNPSLVTAGTPGCNFISGNILDTPAKLNAPADNGGGFLTMRPQAGSPAINAGSNTIGLAFDQRGGPLHVRNFGGGVDMGAIEAVSFIPFVSGTVTDPTVTAANVGKFNIAVTFADDTADFDVSSMKTGNVTVTGKAFPAGIAATFDHVDPAGNGNPRTAYYFVNSPGTFFTAADNGSYSVALNANQVKTVDTRFVPPATLATFSVAVGQTFTVTTTNDAVDPFDGVMSLREAINAANASTATDSIAFDASFATPQTIFLGLGVIAISDALVINNPGGRLTIDGGGISGAFSVTGSAISITNLTLANCSTTALNIPGDSTATVTNCTFENNKSGQGGALWNNSGPLTITGSQFVNNTSTGTGGAIYIRIGTVTIDRTTFSGNTAATTGGAIDVNFNAQFAVSLSISNSTLSGNSAGTGGGAIFNRQSKLFLLENSTISGNTTAGIGGGMYILANALQVGSTTIRNSTITKNVSNGAGAGGLHIVQTTSDPIVITSTILADNTQTTGNLSDYSGPAKAAFSKSLLGVANAATPSAGDLTAGGNLFGSDATPLSPQIASLSLNSAPAGSPMTHALLVGSPAVDAGSNPAGLPFDQRGTGFPRLLGAAVDIGAFEGVLLIPIGSMKAIPPIVTPGPTPNQVVVTYSDDKGLNASTFGVDDIKILAPDLATFLPVTSFSVDTPGNGTPRTVTYTFTVPANPVAGWDALDNGTYSVSLVGGTISDIDTPTPNTNDAQELGSFKVDLPFTYLVDEVTDFDDGNTSKGFLSIREAINFANLDGGTSVITFDPAVFSTLKTVMMASAQLTIDAAVTITGPAAGVILDGQNLDRLIDVSGAPTGAAIVISNMTLTNGRRFSTLIADAGGALRISDENVTLNNCTVSNSTSFAEGGGIHIDLAAGTLTMNDCVVTGNNAPSPPAFAVGNGGGISVSQGTNATAIIMNRTTVSGNTAAGSGGGIYFANNGSLVVTDSTISGNTSEGGAGGGGIYFFGTVGTAGFIIANSTVSGNNALTAPGGGLELYFNGTGGTVEIRNSTFTANNSTRGGGIGRDGVVAGTVSLSSTIIAGNSVGGVGTAATADLGFKIASSVAGNNNLIGIQDVATNVTLTGTGNQVGSVGTKLDAKLGALALNGAPAGRPLTHALLAGSPAIDKGNNLSGFTFDQRGTGFNRTSGGGTDVGAFEVQVAATPAKVANVKIDDGSAQRSRVRSLTITFDQKVGLPGTVADAFTLTKQGGGAVTLAGAVDGTGTVVTLTFTGGEVEFTSLKDGRYNFSIDATKVTTGGGTIQLDGNGDGTGGDNYVLNAAGSPIPTGIWRLFGDADGDNDVDTSDFGAFRAVFGGTSNIFDFDNDGDVDTTDFGAFRGRFGASV